MRTFELHTRRLSPINWNSRNLFLCVQNYLDALEKGGSPAFWLKQSQKMDLDSITERIN